MLRRVVALRLAAWGLPELVDTARLCVSELVSNVLTHVGIGTPGLLVVSVNGADLRIEVHDPDTRALPAVVVAEADAEGGRGMTLVDALADRWGVQLHEHHKVTWCELATGSAPPGDSAGHPSVTRAEALLDLYATLRPPKCSYEPGPGEWAGWWRRSPRSTSSRTSSVGFRPTAATWRTPWTGPRPATTLNWTASVAVDPARPTPDAGTLRQIRVRFPTRVCGEQKCIMHDHPVPLPWGVVMHQGDKPLLASLHHCITASLQRARDATPRIQEDCLGRRRRGGRCGTSGSAPTAVRP